MSKLLYSMGVLAMISAAIPFSLCGMQWLQGDHEDGTGPGISVAERGRMLRERDANEKQGAVSPLVAQATAFALYLNPPKPAASPDVPRAQVDPPQPAPRPVVATPKFRLLLTSCHHSHPQKSLALISEPGRGDCWVRSGDRVGHLVIESITDGALSYRDGNQLHEVSVAMKQTVEFARLASAAPAATQGVMSEVRLVNASRMKESDVRVPDAGPIGHDQD